MASESRSMAVRAALLFAIALSFTPADGYAWVGSCGPLRSSLSVRPTICTPPRLSKPGLVSMQLEPSESRTTDSLWLPPHSVSRRQAIQFSAGSVLAAAAPSRTLAADATAVELTNGGGKFPLVSFGLQIYDDNRAKELTLVALEAGVRNFFSSVLAGNQRGFAQAVKESGIPRSELYICGSVVSNRAQGFKSAYRATTKGWENNMKEFSAGNIDYLDQIMLDYPARDQSSILGQWKAFEEMKAAGLSKSLSVSNFSPEQLDVILNDKESPTKPCVNQLPLNLAYHPGGARETVKWNSARGVLVQAWAPLGASTGGLSGKIKKSCAAIGAKYGKSSSQVALRWLIESGAGFTTSASKKSHFQEDLALFDFALDQEDLQTLDALSPN